MISVCVLSFSFLKILNGIFMKKKTLTLTGCFHYEHTREENKWKIQDNPKLDHCCKQAKHAGRPKIHYGLYNLPSNTTIAGDNSSEYFRLIVKKMLMIYFESVSLVVSGLLFSLVQAWSVHIF